MSSNVVTEHEFFRLAVCSCGLDDQLHKERQQYGGLVHSLSRQHGDKCEARDAIWQRVVAAEPEEA